MTMEGWRSLGVPRVWTGRFGLRVKRFVGRADMTHFQHNQAGGLTVSGTVVSKSSMGGKFPGSSMRVQQEEGKSCEEEEVVGRKRKGEGEQSVNE